MGVRTKERRDFELVVSGISDDDDDSGTTAAGVTVALGVVVDDDANLSSYFLVTSCSTCFIKLTFCT